MLVFRQRVVEADAQLFQVARLYSCIMYHVLRGQ